MPPRYAYWTILIDQKATAFRAREREELLPTFHQLGRKNTDVVMKWFARGRLWDSPEAAEAAQHVPKPPREKRGRDWRPGGEHRDPRDRFKKRSHAEASRPESSRPQKTSSPGRRSFSPQRTGAPRKSWQRERPTDRQHTDPSPKRKRDTRSSAADPFAPKPKPPAKD
jgi:hypothetical protein